MEITEVYIHGTCSGQRQKDPRKRVMTSVVIGKWDGSVLVETTQAVGSNVLADFLALKEALLWARRHCVTDLRIWTSYQNTLGWAKGNIGKDVKGRDTVVSVFRDIERLRLGMDVEIIWISKDHNEAAIHLEIKQLESVLGSDIVASLRDAVTLA